MPTSRLWTSFGSVDLRGPLDIICLVKCTGAKLILAILDGRRFIHCVLFPGCCAQHLRAFHEEVMKRHALKSVTGDSVVEA